MNAKMSDLCRMAKIHYFETILDHAFRDKYPKNIASAK
jgi:hypothetical protein